MSIKAINEIEEFVWKRDFCQGPTISEIKTKIQDYIRTRRNDEIMDRIITGMKTANHEKEYSIREGRSKSFF